MATASRSPAVRVARGVLWALAAGHLVEAVALRRRARRFVALSPPRRADTFDDDGGRVTVIGASVDSATRDAVGELMVSAGVDVVDLVPGDLPADRALRLLRRVDPDRLHTDPLHTPGGAHEALALSAVLVARMGAQTPLGGEDGRWDRGDAVRRTVDAQRYAPTSAVVRVAPTLWASPSTAAGRWRELDELTAFARPHGALAPALVGLEAAHLLAMAAGLVVAPVPAVVALVTWSVQPALTLAATGDDRRRPALRPRRLGRACLVRLPRALVDNVRTAGVAVTASRTAAREREMPPVAPSPDVLFEVARSTCPWCESASLVGRLDTSDLLQHKPGRFHLDECTDCGHVFQNPALSLRGLDHYYDEFYEGAGAEPWEFAFAAMGDAYRKRTEALARFAEPTAWLDVGTGHGHFCLTARERWPDVRVDGLDLSESVTEAARRGWIDTGYRGLFPDLAGNLPRSYDVVSMHHYLEHTRDPRTELAAAAKVLDPGGHLMIEGPDIDSPWSRRLGRYWRCWFQPQHQHFVTCQNLVAALDDIGFDVVSVERGPAGEGMDITSAVTFWVNRAAPNPRSPWRPPPTLGDRAKRAAVLAAAVPACAVAALVDVAKDAPRRRPGATAPGNAYRVIARRR